MSSCLPQGDDQIKSAAQLQTKRPTEYVSRRGKQLFVGDEPFTAVGPNIYWLGLDENVGPDPKKPSHDRVNEAFATARVMGANAVRSLTLGVSVGNSQSVEMSYGVFNETNYDSIDYAVYAAGQYGLRLVVPLLDDYHYYHGGIGSFLGFQNLPPTDYKDFYDLDGSVYPIFRQYMEHMLQHVNPLTNMTMAEDPTVMAFETGNELGGWDRSNTPPLQWVRNVSAEIKRLAPQTLVMSGTYGTTKDELGIDTVDLYTDHFYNPVSTNRLYRNVHETNAADKVFVVGEYDWTDRGHDPHLYATIVLGFVLPLLAFFIPRRMLPFYVPLPKWFQRRSNKSRRRSRASSGAGGEEPMRDLSNEEQGLEFGTGEKARSSSIGGSTIAEDQRERDSGVADVRKAEEADIDEEAQIENSVDESRASSVSSNSSMGQSSYFGGVGRRHGDKTADLDGDRPYFRIWRYHVYIALVIVFVPIITGLVYRFMPNAIKAFDKDMHDASTNGGSLGGQFYWSLFGRDDQCCHYVTHDDSYTLHYPTDGRNGFSGYQLGLVSEVIKSAYALSGVDPSIAGWNDDFSNFPSVACPQNAP